MVWWMFIPAAISAASALSERGQGDRANANQQSANLALTSAQYSVDLNNIKSQLALTRMNVALEGQASRAEAQRIRSVTGRNAEVIRATSNYNDLLYEDDLALTWEQNELDLELLESQRQLERGGLVAAQSVSGTVIGEGSNADVIENSMTQEALDAFVIQRGADITARKISNARTRSMWEGEMAVRKTLWEGEVNAVAVESNSALRQAGMLSSGMIANAADTETARLRNRAGIMNAGNSFANNASTISNNMNSGLFNAAGQAAYAYYGSKSVGDGSSLIT